MRALFSLVLAALLLSLGSGRALADGQPIQIILTYLPNVSNTGPQSASGVAELVMAEGEVRVAATGLPRLDQPEVYVAWITNPAGEAMRLGSFNTAFTSGAARLDTVLPDAIPDKGWNLLLITLENSPTPDQPSARHSIAGYFPPTPGEAVPNLLPNTGGPVPASPSQPDWLPVAGLATLTLLVGLGAGYAVGIRRSA